MHDIQTFEQNFRRENSQDDSCHTFMNIITTVSRGNVNVDTVSNLDANLGGSPFKNRKREIHPLEQNTILIPLAWMVLELD